MLKINSKKHSLRFARGKEYHSPQILTVTDKAGGPSALNGVAIYGVIKKGLELSEVNKTENCTGKPADNSAAETKEYFLKKIIKQIL